MHCPNLLMLQGSRNDVSFKSAAMQAAHSFIGSDPHAAVAAFQEGADEIVNQPLLGRVVKELLADLTVYSPALRPHPECPLAIAKDIPNPDAGNALDRKSTRLNSSHRCISYAGLCL